MRTRTVVSSSPALVKLITSARCSLLIIFTPSTGSGASSAGSDQGDRGSHLWLCQMRHSGLPCARQTSACRRKMSRSKSTIGSIALKPSGSTGGIVPMPARSTSAFADSASR